MVDLKWRNNNPPAQGTQEQQLIQLPASALNLMEPSFLERVQNRVYFYSEVEQDKILALNRTIRELNGEMLVKQKELSLTEPPKIYIHINSHGGSIFDGLAAVDEIIKSNIPVVTVIDGCAASAATFISVVGKERHMNRHAFMLLHQLSSSFWGKYAEFQDEMQNLKKLMQIIKQIYQEHAKIPDKKIDEILKHDLWWDAKTCLKYGLIDEIL